MQTNWCGLCLQIPVWLDLGSLAPLRIGITPIPQRWPASWRQAWWLGIDSDVIQDLPDLYAVGDERY